MTESNIRPSLIYVNIDEARILRDHGIRPSAQRLALAAYILHTSDHPSADEVWQRVRRRFSAVSRATVYNTLHLLAEKGLLRQLVLTEGRVVFDPRVDLHHHFIDSQTGRIYDVPWDRLRVCDVECLEGFDVREYQVVMRGRRRAAKAS